MRLSATVIMAGVLLATGSSFAGPPAPGGGHAGAPNSGGGGGNSGGNNSGAARPAPANQPADNHPAANGQKGNRDDRRNSEPNNGNWHGNPWSPYSSGWGYDAYPDSDGSYSQATFTDNSSSNDTGTAPASTVLPQSAQGSPAQSAAGAEAQLTNTIDKSPEMIAANNAVRSAQVAYATERGRALSALAVRPEFQQALDRKHNAAKTLQETKSSGQPQSAVIDAATAKLDAGDEVTKMREEAVAADPGASAAKSLLMQAIANRDALRARMLSRP